MRFMIIVKTTKDSEAGILPNEKLLAEMGGDSPMTESRSKVPTSSRAPKTGELNIPEKIGLLSMDPLAKLKNSLPGLPSLRVASREEAIEWI